MNKKLLIPLLCLIGGPLAAIRPEGNYGGKKQLDIAKLEADLGAKFSIPFPEKRYDIDFFFKGDLLPGEDGEVGFLVTCPFVAGDLISVGFGSGTDGKSYRMMGDLTVSLSKDGKWLSVFVMSSILGEETPGLGVRPDQKEDEKPQDFFNRVENYWLKRIADGKTKMSANQVEAAFKVMATALVQKPEFKFSSAVEDPTVEKELRGK